MVAAENPCKQGDNTETPHKKGPRQMVESNSGPLKSQILDTHPDTTLKEICFHWESNQQPFPCQVNMLTTTEVQLQRKKGSQKSPVVFT